MKGRREYTTISPIWLCEQWRGGMQGLVKTSWKKKTQGETERRKSRAQVRVIRLSAMQRYACPLSLRWWMLSLKGGRTRMQTAISDTSPASGQQHYLRALEEFIKFLNCWYKNNHHFWSSLEWECTLDLNTIHLQLLQFLHECVHYEESD